MFYSLKFFQRFIFIPCLALILLELSNPETVNLNPQSLAFLSVKGSPQADNLSAFTLGDGPWISTKILPGMWRNITHSCNPYSGRCSCLQEWGVHLDECNGKTSFKSVVIEVDGWMTDWPYLPGLHRCQRSVCDVRHGHTSDSRTHARLFSVTNAEFERANANGSIMVVVAMESRSRIPLHGTLEFKHFFDIGVSYHNNLDIQVSYNNYLPTDFTNPGVPFDQKRNSLAFMHSNCRSAYRNELFDSISRLIPVDAVGSCKKNVDLSTILPQCTGLPRSGDTVWLESECILHHYKFYLAIENSRDEDYVTEMLYQGLRSGSVPIYLGAPNVRDYLPHPDSILLIEDFDSLEALVDYIKRASLDEKLYAKHMAWKSMKLPDQFMDRVVTRPVDSIFCKTCDLIATKYGDGVGPITSAKGDKLIIPWCIVYSLRANSGAIVRKWHPQITQSESKLQTYVLSVKGADDRQEFMRGQLTSAHLQADLVLAYDANVLDLDTIACWRPQSTLDSRLKRDFMGPKLISSAMKYFLAVWDMWQQGLDVALILEDDAELAPTFTPEITAALLEAPPFWDMIVVGTCGDMHAFESQRVSQRLFQPPFPEFPTRCGHAILWSYSGAKKILASLPIIFEFDTHTNAAAGKGGWSAFWMEPALSYQRKSLTSLLQVERDELNFKVT